MSAAKQKKYLVVITGPTCSGKTALSIEVAKHLQTEIISADSRQIFKEMSIGTAVPTAEELAAVKHHFIHSHSVRDPFTAGDFEREGLELLQSLFLKYDTVILCGGSGMYIEALCSGFDDLPQPKAGERERLNEIYRKDGILSIQELLKKEDPEYYEQVDQQNPQRLIRALEICSSGIKYSETRKGKKKERPFESIFFMLEPPREELYRKIDARVEDMIQRGLVEEAKALLPYRDRNALQTVGYAELFEYFDDSISLPEAIDKIRTNTRHYAKRQLTWLRKKEGTRLNTPDPSVILEKLKECL